MTQPAASPAAVFITGAGRNLGAYMAQHLHAAGQPVIAHYRSRTTQTAALAAAGVDLVQGDFSAAEAIAAVAAKVQEAAPRLRAIIHNASAFAPTAAADLAAARQMQEFFTVHMLAPFLLNRLLAANLAGSAEEPADIIHITDIYADNPAVEFDSYCATKAGLQNLALSAAQHLAPAIKVNVIQPGPIHFQDWHDTIQRQRVLAATPLARTGGAAAILTAVKGILANPFQTGAIISVDGGRRLTGR